MLCARRSTDTVAASVFWSAERAPCYGRPPGAAAGASTTRGKAMRSKRVLYEGFYFDGGTYTLTSRSLGGTGHTPETVASVIDGKDLAAAQRLVHAGVALPLAFEGDCMLDGAVFVVGELSEEEQQHWVGRIRARLRVPCGKLVLMGGGITPENYDPDDSEAYAVVDVEPGEYDVQLLFYPGSYRAMEHLGEDADALTRWLHETRPGEPEPGWLRALREGDDLFDRDTLVGYLVHLSPAQGPAPQPKVEAVAYTGNFVEQTELRRPERFPLGLERAHWERDAERLRKPAAG